MKKAKRTAMQERRAVVRYLRHIGAIDLARAIERRYHLGRKP